MKGIIQKMYEINCGRCNKKRYLNHSKIGNAIIEAKQKNWKLTINGWTCLLCQDSHQIDQKDLKCSAFTE